MGILWMRRQRETVRRLCASLARGRRRRAHPTAAVGVSIEPLASALEKESGLVRHKETFAKRVAEDLYVYMQSFQTDESAASDRMVVPVNILQKWFEKFTNRFRRDPGYLDRPRLDVA